MAEASRALRIQKAPQQQLRYDCDPTFALASAEQAVAWLEFAAQDGFPCYPLFESDSNLDNIRQDPGYINFMAKLNLQWVGYQAMF